MNFRSWSRALRKSWWVIVLCTIIGVGAGLGVTLLTPEKYSSSVTFFVRTPAEQIGGAYQGDQFAQKRVNSYVQLAKSQRLAELIRTDAQVDLTAQQIASEIDARGDTNTVLLTATVTDTDPARSLDIATSLSRSLIELVAQLETPPGSTQPTVTLDVTSAASLQTTPVQPKPLINLAVGLLAGILLGLAIALLRELKDATVRSARDIEQVTAQVPLATIPFDPRVKETPLITGDHAKSVRAEAYRQLRTNLLFTDVDKKHKIVTISSAVPGEGKTSAACNLAIVFAEAGHRVLLIEGDLRRPRVATYMDVEGAVGLSDVLAGRVDINDVLQPWGTGGLTVLPSGYSPPNPSELLGSENMRALLKSMSEVFDIVIIDSPPLLPVTDAAILASMSDGAVLVCRYGRTRRNQVANAHQALTSVDASFIGAVLSMSPEKQSAGYYSSNYYGDSLPPVSSSPSTDNEASTDPSAANLSEPGLARNQHVAAS